MQQKAARSWNLAIDVFPSQHKYVYSPTAQNAPVHTQQRQRPDQNLRQKRAVYNRKISEYTHVAWKGTKISQCFGVRSLSYRSNQGIEITKMK